MLRKILFVFALVFTPFIVLAKPPELTPQLVNTKMQEIMKAHASYKMLNRQLIQRILKNYLDELDPIKTYLNESDIQKWLNPSDALLDEILKKYNNSDFSEFAQIQDTMVHAIERRRLLEKQIDTNDLPKHVSPSEFKDMKWTKDEQELLNRLRRIRALQVSTSAKLNDELKDKALQRIFKRQTSYEDNYLKTDPVQRERWMLSNLLKASAASLDTHTAYLTPDEATQFMINVQQRLSGIGAQLRDDLDGFTVIKIIEGSPAALGKELKIKDRVIAVNGEPVVGMDIIEAVELIRGEEGTPVTLTIIREVEDGDNKREEKRDIVIKRSAIVLKETRYDSSYEPFGDGVIGYLRLYSFYQDDTSSSAEDLTNEIKKLQNDHKLKGLILDLRYNTGGLLSQAVEVTGLFITKGVVVSIKDDAGAIQHLRGLDGKTVWDGPLIVLVNRASASASEIVAQALKDYGRALIIGDDHTYGKGSFQTFTLSNAPVNTQGEYKVTRGRYYTVSGKTPQLTGVISDVVVPGALSETDIGERFADYPLENDRIKENYDDDLSDVPFTQREKVRALYKFNLQQILTTYNPYMENLRDNSKERIQNNKNYQKFLKELKKQDNDIEDTEESYGQNDLQLTEAYNIMKDLILLMQRDGVKSP
jgi:carboxyl-terminal processing protease